MNIFKKNMLAFCLIMTGVLPCGLTSYPTQAQTGVFLPVSSKDLDAENMLMEPSNAFIANTYITKAKSDTNQPPVTNAITELATAPLSASPSAPLQASPVPTSGAPTNSQNTTLAKGTTTPPKSPLGDELKLNPAPSSTVSAPVPQVTGVGAESGAETDNNQSSTTPSTDKPWQKEHDIAVQKARAGHYDEALSALAKLRKEHPQDGQIIDDEVVISNWAGHDQNAVKLFQSKIKDHAPDYVYRSIGLSYRNLHEPQKALKVYREGLKYFPDDQVLLAGEILSLSESGQYQDAVTTAKSHLKTHGHKFHILLAAATVTEKASQKISTAHGEIYEALVYYQQAHSLAPDNREALHGLILTTDRAGMPEIALEMALKHPHAVDANETQTIEGDRNAQLVRWGVLTSSDEHHRYDATDRALATLDRTIQVDQQDPAKHRKDLLRARFDRVVALHNRNRMDDVIHDYEQLLSEQNEIPDYVVAAVVDAYLYEHNPEKARDLALGILDHDPTNFDVRLQLYFAYVECDDFDHAYSTIDTLDHDQSVWIYLKGLSTPQVNEKRRTADLEASLARLYGGETNQAYERVSSIVNEAPGNSENHKAMGAVLDTLGLPRQAADEYTLSQSLYGTGRDLGAETGLATTAIEMQDYPLAESRVTNLMSDYPENLEVQRVHRSFQSLQKAELQVEGNYDSKPSTSQVGGEGYGVGATLYSEPFNYNWRIFAGERFAHQAEPNHEGFIDLTQTKAGVEYRKDSLTIETAPTISTYSSTDHVGGYGHVQYSFSDNLSSSLLGSLVSQKTPLRAMNKGVLAHEVTVGTRFQETNLDPYEFSLSYLPFTDQNQRMEEGLSHQTQLYAEPGWTLDGLGTINASQNSKDENRPYFNPRSDVTAAPGLKVTQNLYHRYETHYEHSLAFSPGIYWQSGYDSSFTYSLTYSQSLHLSDDFEASFGVGLVRHTYDGVYENDINTFINLMTRFW